ncbi:Rv1733c family protein [Streptomyces pilosus]|uniref:Rv1733c family protein n=1 Tax=Streptomyces pilosus TaxID=28893 RepID=UPI00362EC3A3
MAGTHSARPRRVRLWRWRSNPLRRRSDVIEAWVLLATVVLALLVGAFAGVTAAGVVDGSIEDRREGVRPVPAVLVEDAAHALPASVTEDSDGGVWAKVRWTAPDGAVRTGRAEVGAGTKAGTEVTVWNDRAGRLASAPPEGAEARFQVVMAGTTVAVATGGLVVLGGWLLRSRLQWRRLAEWEAEWQRVEPSWRKRMTG